MRRKSTVTTRFKQARRPTFIRAWRLHRHRTLESVAEDVGITHASLSRIERGLQDYTGELLELLAVALQCEPVDLLIRNPSDPDGIWSIWDRAAPGERRQLVTIGSALLSSRTRTDG